MNQLNIYSEPDIEIIFVAPQDVICYSKDTLDTHPTEDTLTSIPGDDWADLWQ